VFSSETVTRGVRVRVKSQYDPSRSRPNQQQWFFLYTIQISNEGAETVQLISRHWIITDANGKVEEVQGPGVVGEQPVLATGKVRYVGELVAMCIAPTRAEAEDLAGEIDLDLDPLPVVADMLEARKLGATLVHEHWGDNLFLTSAIDVDLTFEFQNHNR